MTSIIAALDITWTITAKANIACIRAFKTKNVVTKGQIIDNLKEFAERRYLRRKVQIAEEWIISLRAYLPDIVWKKPLEITPKIVGSVDPLSCWPLESSATFVCKKPKLL
jgi:hypothetical protein